MNPEINLLERYPQYNSTPLTEEQKQSVHDVRVSFAFAHENIMVQLPEGRYKAIVATKLEEAAMFATKAITHTPKV